MNTKPKCHKCINVYKMDSTLISARAPTTVDIKTEERSCKMFSFREKKCKLLYTRLERAISISSAHIKVIFIFCNITSHKQLWTHTRLTTWWQLDCVLKTNSWIPISTMICPTLEPIPSRLLTSELTERISLYYCA